MEKFFILTVVVGVTAAVAFAAENKPVPSGFDLAVTETGALKLPDVDFRSDWTMLGGWAINGDGNAEGMHIVYTQPGIATIFRETGAFPDGAVLIKELLSTQTEDLPTGRVSYADQVQGWFVMVKDTEGRYPDNALWGDGWGWGFFGADNPQTLVTTDYKEECIACHVPAEDTDWIYTRGYPVLQGD